MSLEVLGKGTQQEPFVLSEEGGFFEDIRLEELIAEMQNGAIDPVVWLQMIGTDGREIVAEADLNMLAVLAAHDAETGELSPDAFEEFETLLSNVEIEGNVSSSFAIPTLIVP